MKALYYIVASKYLGKQALDIVASLRAGERVELRREPTNLHDPNAVQVWARGVLVGYLPAPEAARLAPRIDASSDAAKWGGVFAATGDRRPSVEVDES